MVKNIDIKDIEAIVDETVSDASHAAKIKEWLHEDDAVKDKDSTENPEDTLEGSDKADDDLWDNLPV